MDATAIGGEVEAVYNTVRDRINEALHGAATVQTLEAKLRDRDYPLAPGDVPLVRDKATQARHTVDAAFKAAEVGINAVLKAQLLVASMPKVDGADYDRATKEAELLLSGSAGPELVTRMRNLAAGGDRRLAAGVTGTWGLARLRGAQDDHHVVRLAALGAAIEHGSPTEKRHAEAYTRLPSNLAKQLGVARYRANERMRVS
jgi:hypothetical protein